VENEAAVVVEKKELDVNDVVVDLDRADARGRIRGKGFCMYGWARRNQREKKRDRTGFGLECTTLSESNVGTIDERWWRLSALSFISA
jgi:hypothetical protein